MSNNRRLELHKILEEIIGSKNVYYKAPENLKMQYPCIKYSRDDIETDNADNVNYLMHDRYSVIVIDKNPDNPAIKKILALPMSSFDRQYISDNMYHDVIRLYY